MCIYNIYYFLNTSNVYSLHHDSGPTEWGGLGSQQGQKKMREALALVAMKNKTTNEGRTELCVDVSYLAYVIGNHGSDGNKNV